MESQRLRVRFRPIADIDRSPTMRPDARVKTTATIAHPAFLREIEVVDENGLRIIVEERTAFRHPEPDGLGLGFEAREIVQGTTDRAFEILWRVVVCFAVRGDHFPKGPITNATIGEGDSDSAFIGWVKRDSNTGSDYLALLAGHDDDDRELRHWIVSTNEAQIDVASPYPPDVKPLRTQSAERPLSTQSGH